MPYIKKSQRRYLECHPPRTPGELQYVMAKMFKDYVHRHGLRYQTCNDVMGALAGAQMEFYRKVVGPYEAEAEIKNGSI